MIPKRISMILKIVNEKPNIFDIKTPIYSWIRNIDPPHCGECISLSIIELCTIFVYAQSSFRGNSPIGFISNSAKKNNVIIRYKFLFIVILFFRSLN